MKGEPTRAGNGQLGKMGLGANPQGSPGSSRGLVVGMRRTAWLVLGLVAAATVLLMPTPPIVAQGRPPAKPSVDFELAIRPVLAGRCGSCHGAQIQSGGLRLDSREAMLKGGRRGPAVQPGKPLASLLFRVITGADAALKMPPDGTLPAASVAAIKRWIEDGAVWPAVSAAQAAPNPGAHWAFQPVRAVEPPPVRDRRWVRNPIDAFILSKLEKEQIQPAPPASPRDLARRVTLDLTGLPPTAEDLERFESDARPDRYERLVDSLLASPRYGERWARYWLDLVRYADTNGYERDGEKPYSWKYRDWVIRSLNEDKSYQRFVTEQLAGDELPDRTEQTVAATGFLRLGTWDDEPNDPLDYQYERLDDLVHASGTAFLSLTIRCARCHDHKYDPIPQKDYYAIAASFWGGYLRPGDGKLMGGPPLDRLGFPVLGFTDEGPHPPALRLLEKGDARRPAATVDPGYLSLFPALNRPVTQPPMGAVTTHRRSQLAAWITDPKHPLTSRVTVNRLWQHHFGFGLVRTPNNFGMKGEPPTHPELLDWLARTFVSPTGSSPFAAGWRLKAMHRLMVTSATYRMASVHPAAAQIERKDALNKLWWRFNRRRLDADALRDSMLAVSGELNLSEGGRGFVPSVSREALEGLSRKGAEWSPSAPDDQKRRTVYMFLKRALIMPLLTVFDFGDTTAPIEQRESSIVPTQALGLLNNAFVVDRSTALARSVARTETDPKAAARLAWRRVLGRNPTPSELADAVRFVAATADRYRSTPQSVSDTALEPPALPGLALWLRADRGVERDPDGRVEAWLDQSAAGVRFVQPVTLHRPAMSQLGGGARPALSFDGNARWLKSPAQVISSQAMTLVAVITDRAGNGSHREILSNWRREGNVGSSLFLGTTGPSLIRFSDVFAPAGTLAQPERPSILTAQTGAGSSMVFQDRAVLAERASALEGRKLEGPYVIGQQGNIGGEYWKGEIAEVIAFNRSLDAVERVSLWNYLSRRYGIAPAPRPPSPELRALQALCHVLVNTNEFAFVD